MNIEEGCDNEFFIEIADEASNIIKKAYGIPFDFVYFRKNTYHLLHEGLLIGVFYKTHEHGYESILNWLLYILYSEGLINKKYLAPNVSFKGESTPNNGGQKMFKGIVLGMGISLLSIFLLLGVSTLDVVKEKHLVIKKTILDDDVFNVIKEFVPHVLDKENKLKVKVKHINVDGVKYSLETL